MDNILGHIGTLKLEDKERLMTALWIKVKTESTDTKKVEDEVDPRELPFYLGLVTATPPQLPQFSGGDNKGNIIYQQRAYEVKGLLQSQIYSEALVLQAVRRSLRGTAADVLLNLGHQVEVSEVLRKMEQVFGNILPPEKLLEQFYSSQQREEQRAAVWACRLEDTLTQLRSKKSAPLSAEGAADMLRTKFFSGLRPGLVITSLRYRFDSSAPYEDLLVAARVAEMEEEKDKKEVKVQQATAVDKSTGIKLDSILKQLESMQSRLDDLEKKKTSYQQENNQKPFPGKCHKCGETGHKQWKCPLNSNQPASRGNGQAVTDKAPAK